MSQPSSSGRKTVLELLHTQRIEEAQELGEQLLRTNPNDPVLWSLLSTVHGMLNQLGDAERCANESIRLQPDYAEAYNNLGLALHLQGRLREAIPAFLEALRLEPDYAEAHYNLGIALVQDQRPKEAIEHYRHALETRPAFYPVHRDLTSLLIDAKRFDDVLLQCDKTLRHFLDDVDTLVDMGIALQQLGRFGEAINAYRRAIAAGGTDTAEAHFNLSLLLLAHGCFRTGWQEYAWQWKREGAHRRRFAPSGWDGSNLDGQPVFLHAEQGIGDEIFFLRFVPWLKQRGAGVVSHRPTRKIASLLARSPLIDRVLYPKAIPSPNDLVFSVGDLPRLLGMERLDQIPPPMPMPPLPEQIVAMRDILAKCGPPPYIGITWRAGATKRNTLYKEVPLGLLAQLLRDLPVTVLILQRLPQADEVPAFRRILGRHAHDLSVLNENLEQMLALQALINDYIGVSNTNMHLRAGAGKTARVLVPAPPEWRWMAEGSESPWFPGFTVYRQGYDGDWTSAFECLAKDLRSLH